jgi:hypothetical protein
MKIRHSVSAREKYTGDVGKAVSLRRPPNFSMRLRDERSHRLMIRDDQKGRAFELVVLSEPVRAAVRMNDRYAFVVAQHLLLVDTGSDPEGRRSLALAVNVAEVHTRDGGVSAAVVPYARGIAAGKGIVSGVRSLRLSSGLLVGELDTFATPNDVLTGGKVSRSISLMSWLRSGAAAAARRMS